MTKHHNKKRNVGIIHEQLVRYVGSAIMSKDDKLAQSAVSIITNHFKSGSELHKEFKLFNALVNIPMGDREIAKLVVQEAKRAAQTHNKMALSNEKSSLIKTINHTLSEEKFYDIRVPNYKLYATVQTLLDSWRGMRSLEITESAKFESSLIEWISRKSVISEQSEAKQDPLIYKVMIKKFQEKYGKNLLPSQKKIVETFLTKGSKSLEKELEFAKKDSLESLKEFKKNCENKFLLEKIDRVVQNIEKFPALNEEESVKRTLKLLELVSELKGDNDE